MNEIVRYLKENQFHYVKFDEPLSKYTSFKVGGNAAIVVTPETKEKTIDLVHFLNKYHFKYKIIGNGSNILPSDKEYRGVIIKTNKALDYLQIDDNLVTVGSGYLLTKLAYRLVDYELSGLEFVGGIPGSIGGAVFMNAGAYNKEMKDVVESVTLLDENGKLINLSKEELKYGYRHSILQIKKPQLIVEATLRLEEGNKEDMLHLLNQRKQRRRDTQPLEYPSGGSTFRNPNNMHAYQLIDKVGLRGYQIGGAKVSEKHCNFVINYDHATSQNIKDLIEFIMIRVYNETGIRLIPEIELFNW